MAHFAVLFPAAGRSRRYGDAKEKKIYAELLGRAVWLRAVEPFVNREDVKQLIVGIAADDRELFERRYGASVAFLNIRVIEGGDERHDTVARMLSLLDSGIDYVAVHDAARPCVTSELIDAVFAAALECGAAVPGVPVGDTLKRVDERQMIRETVSRAGLVTVQTPQAFRRDWLVAAYNMRAASSAPTDDAQLVEASGRQVVVVPGHAGNLKITMQEDLRLAAAVLAAMPQGGPERACHPFAEEGPEAWDSIPKLKPGDLFPS
jgi:2-C-methyl-D-erythritol 4-phosphate cytidylyltransferase